MKRLDATSWPPTKRRKFKTDRIRKQTFIGHRKEIRFNELELLAVVSGEQHF